MCVCPKSDGNWKVKWGKLRASRRSAGDKRAGEHNVSLFKEGRRQQGEGRERIGRVKGARGGGGGGGGGGGVIKKKKKIHKKGGKSQKKTKNGRPHPQHQ